MKIQIVPHFIIIDDDPVNNLICHKHIQLLFTGADIKTFTDPQVGLDYIRLRQDQDSAILFLDINMPLLNGWDVLDALINFPEIIKQKLKIYILSSSISDIDKQKAENNPLVKGFIGKPLTTFHLQNVVTNF